MSLKKLAALILGACMVLALLAGCTGTKNEETTKAPETTTTAAPETEAQTETEAETEPAPEVSADPIEKITQGVYGYTFYVDSAGFDDTNMFHFYEEQPVYGKIWYAGFVVNQINFYGTYEVKEEPCDWALWENRDAEVNEEEMITGTAPYTVYFYDMNGNEIDKCGFDGDVLYQDMENITFQGSGHQKYQYVSFDSEDYESFYSGEAGQIITDLVGDEDRTSTLQLFHTGRYSDLVAYEIEGSWLAEQGSDGIVYTLTPDDATESVVKLTLKDDGTAVYAPEGGDEVAMHIVKDVTAAYTFAGEGPEVSEGTNAALTLTLLSDNTVTLDADAFGNVLTIDQGTWEQINDYTFKVVLDLAGEVESELVESTPTFNLTETGSQLGDFEAALAIVLPEE